MSPKHFLLATEWPYFKKTPDFAQYIYDSRICHRQIGEDVTEKKSIVVIKTTVGISFPSRGCLEKAPYIVGYFRVAENKDGLIFMDRNDSLLLLDDPIKIDRKWAIRLFPEKPLHCWSDPTRILRNMTLRNCHIKHHQLQIILEELCRRKENGSKNYLGIPYAKLMPKQEKIYNYI